MEGAPRRRGLLLAAIAAITVATATARATLGSGPVLLGSAGAEVYGHAWVQHEAARAFPRLPDTTDTVLGPLPVRWTVIDPAVTWVAAALQTVIDGVTAWNLLCGLGLAGAVAGGWAIARRAGGEPAVGAVVLGLGPIVGGSFASGLTEDWGVGLLAVALALVGRPGWRAAAAAGLALGALAWLGLYLALLGAIGAAILGLAALGERRWRELALAALLALVVALPAAGRQGQRLWGVGHDGGTPSLRDEPHWRLNPHHAADVLAFVTPGPDPVDDGALIRLHPSYLGLAALGLAALSRGRARWWVVALASWLLALGPVVRLAGHPTGLPNPVGAVASGLPLLSLVHHWGRLGLLGQVALAALAAHGARRLGRWAPFAAVVVAADYVFLSPGPWPLPVADAAIPPIHRSLDALPGGGVLVVPSAGPGVPFQRPLYRQRGHGRPLAIDPNRPGYGRVAAVPLVRALAGLPGERKDPPPPELARSRTELLARGVAVILVEDPYVQDVTAVLGSPDVVAPGGAAWAVERLRAP